ncbi:MAG: hypothetical protein J0H74_23690 [Chitinophagaceae bacterium]|nr:hypothetical protein [Chitinophagaceae bacterium]
MVKGKKQQLKQPLIQEQQLTKMQGIVSEQFYKYKYYQLFIMRIMINSIYTYVIIGVACMGSLGFLSCGKKASAQRNTQPPPVKRLSDTSMMIGIYVAPPFAYTSVANYQQIKDANVDFIQDISGQESAGNKLTMLNMANSVGLKIIVADNRMDGTDAQIVSMVDTYKTHPAVIGYYIKDEPTVSQLNDAAIRYKKVLNYDSTKAPHVNLLSSYATGALGNIDYENDYVKKWINMVGPTKLKYISMDNYPFLANGQFQQDPYYYSLDVIRRLGLQYHIKTSAYMQSIGGGANNLRRPNANELRFSAYSILAYGIKIPVWFTYWTPAAGAETFTNAIVDPAGGITDLYNPFQILNGELRKVGKTLVKLDAMAVYHSGTTLPVGAETIPASFMVKPVDAAANIIMTYFVNPADGKKYVMVVNKSLTAGLNATFSTDNTITNVQSISKTTGDAAATDFNSATHQLSASFLPGEGILFTLTM